mgnify:CR=1 FL=1
MGMVGLEKVLPLGLGAPKEVDSEDEVSFVQQEKDSPPSTRKVSMNDETKESIHYMSGIPVST